ncbi:hypothetical protein NLI96_g2073 [Meripilus lineatus]|uniref:DUF6534 domain-containing protein n=1 Tax=Meripilus lineatus TaxID=2056292 RepID=A0AAD5YGX9_9APHY|nr:hypothetical protein NLI96_g2073 [Physisporinus lineatus]
MDFGVKNVESANSTPTPSSEEQPSSQMSDRVPFCGILRIVDLFLSNPSRHILVIMSSPCSPPLELDLDDTLGAVYIGNLAAAILFGVTSFQTITYFNRYPKDKNVTKVLIMILWVLDFLHLIMISHAFYFYTVKNYMNPVALLKITWSLVVHVFFTATSDLIVRGIFAHRVWQLSGGNLPLLGTIVIAALAVYAGAIVFAIRAAKVAAFLRFNEISALIYYSLAATAAADIIISGSLCYFLSRKRTAFKRTQSLIKSLIVYTINAGAFTWRDDNAEVRISQYATMPDNFIFQAFYFVLPKLFLNSLLAMMNARHSIRDPTPTDPYSIPLSKTSSTGRMEYKSRNAHDRTDQGIDIQIETTMERKFDEHLVRAPVDSTMDIKSPVESSRWAV